MIRDKFRLRSFTLGCIFLLFANQKVDAQDSLLFFQIIQGDSVALFFNKEFSFTEKDCFDYVRHIRVTEKGDFNGYFEDRSIDQILLGKGSYSNGLKHGYFEIYYPTGKILSKGYYENNLPIGIWEYFYPWGLPERTLDISDSVVLLLRHVDREGNVKVENGRGKFDGFISGSGHVRGNIVNGKPDGKWLVLAPDYSSLYTEKFQQGNLVKSSLVTKRKMEILKIQPRLNNFFLGSYIYWLEGFYRQSCKKSAPYYFNKYLIDSHIFRADLGERIDELIKTEVRVNNSEKYVFGDNFMTIRFSVDEKGKANDITLLSAWDEQFFAIAKNAINKIIFSTPRKSMYFNFKLSYAGGLKYKYTFKFSKRPHRNINP